MNTICESCSHHVLIPPFWFLVKAQPQGTPKGTLHPLYLCQFSRWHFQEHSGDAQCSYFIAWEGTVCFSSLTNNDVSEIICKSVDGEWVKGAHSEIPPRNLEEVCISRFKAWMWAFMRIMPITWKLDSHSTWTWIIAGHSVTNRCTVNVCQALSYNGSEKANELLGWSSWISRKDRISKNACHREKGKHNRKRVIKEFSFWFSRFDGLTLKVWQRARWRTSQHW